jgi:uncharacterized protein YcbK (DUF882 family)/LAS superfamily LD-carboxypeptidase LdcB
MSPDTILHDYEYEIIESLPASRLQWPSANSEQLEFMRRVYNYNVQRSSRNGKFIGDIPVAELEIIEGGHKAKTAAARSCKSMLASARNAINNEGINVEIGITSAYRSASRQFNLWQSYFPGYYADTVQHRDGLPGGPHGNDSVQWLGRYIGARIATPGFSNHQNGIAVDLLNKENGTYLRNSTKPLALQAWKQTWFWRWLTDHAASYHFYQNTNINEPWHWEYKPASMATEADYYFDENAIISPPLIKKEQSPPSETIYVNYNIGIQKAAGDKAGTVNYTVKPISAIFVPENFTAGDTTDLVIFLHGHKSEQLGKDKSIDDLWNGSRFPHFRLRELTNETGRSIILVAPTLGPRSQPGNLVTSQGFSSFVIHMIAAINTHLSQYFPSGFHLGKIILACHSGGGNPMKKIALLTDHNNYYASKITECWGFDCLYNGDDAAKWTTWAKQNPDKKVYQYYIPNSPTADQGDKLKNSARRENIVNLQAIPTTDRRHNWIPALYWQQRINGLSAVQINTAGDQEHECTENCCCNEHEDVLFTEATVSFPSGEQLAVVSGPEQPGDEYYDPNNAGNPLLDTSGANKQKKLSANFTVSEIARSGGRSFDKARIDVRLIECLQAIRDHVGKSVSINSGYRSYGYNEELRSRSSNVATKSQHMSGRAADIRIEGMSGFEIAKAALDAYGCNIGIGLAPSFAHIDVRGSFAVWRYAGDPAAITQQLQQIRNYQAQCVTSRRNSSKLQPLNSPLQLSPALLTTVADLLRRGYLGITGLYDFANGEISRERLSELVEANRYQQYKNYRKDANPIAEDFITTENYFPRRVASVSELTTSWSAEGEKEIQKQYGGSPRNQTRQNDFNDSLFNAQNEWDLLDPYILKSLLAQESNYNPVASNNLGFAGIAQLGMQEAKSVGLNTGNSLEQTSAHRRRKENYLNEYYDFKNDERFQPGKAIPAAARLLKRKWQSLQKNIFQRYGNPSTEDFYYFILGAYNGGEGTVKNRVRRIYGSNPTSPLNFNDLGSATWITYAKIIMARSGQ